MLDGGVEQRLVGTDADGSMPQEAAMMTLGLASSMRVASSLRGEAAEHDRVDGAEARAGEHGDGGLRHHRHVDHDAVALADAEIAQHAGQRATFLAARHR
jgi:hypothetical protein